MQRELFRAKEVNENNWIISDSIEWDNDRLYLLNEKFEQVECEPETRSVSYPNMIDKNGKKIFASLSEDGVGGDEIFSKYSGKTIVTFKNMCYLKHDSFEVIGIHKG